MAAINSAYAVLQKHLKSEGSKQQQPSSHVNQTTWKQYTEPHDSPFGGWDEDLFTMGGPSWEETFQQRHHPNDRSTLHQKAGFHQENRKSHSASRAKPRSEAPGGSNKATNAGSKIQEWSEDELNALWNMYSEGKSFDFIANALGKKTGDVIAAYNEISAANLEAASFDHFHSYFHPGANYPEVHTYVMDEDGSILEEMDPDDFDEDDDPFPYGGRPIMHGARGGHHAPRGRGGSRGRGRGSPPRPHSHHRGPPRRGRHFH
jgi:hypothetical protein